VRKEEKRGRRKRGISSSSGERGLAWRKTGGKKRKKGRRGRGEE